jgi:putative DNA primase/helicase
MHTHVFDRYMVTPRLLLTSPVRHCGKSVALDVLDRLVARPYLTDNITAAVVYDTIDGTRCTLLMDEFDNQEISAKAALRAVLNAGYRNGRKITRGVGKTRREYSVFAPIAIAAIGTLPLRDRIGGKVLLAALHALGGRRLVGILRNQGRPSASQVAERRDARGVAHVRHRIASPVAPEGTRRRPFCPRLLLCRL